MTDAATIVRVPPRRLPDWQTRLGDLIGQRMRAPFAWGRHDCVMFAADAVLAVTGADLAQGLRGTYTTADEAAAVLQQHGGLIELCIRRLGPVVPVTLAQPGDVGLVRMGDVPALVVCGGAHFLGVGAAGLQPMLPEEVVRTWRCTQEAQHG